MKNKNNDNVTEIKDVVQDLTGASLEVGTSMFLESLPELGVELAEIMGNQAFDTAIQTLTGGLLGAVAPAFLGIKLSFQQKRFERNMIKMVNAIKQKQDIIEQRLNLLDLEVREKFITGPYRDILLDNIISENQEQKVQDNINGYINLMGVENPNDDIVFTFFNTLAQMNELDIRVLRLYRPTWETDDDERETFTDVMRDENIDESQYNFIRRKLYRLGMLNSKNEERRNGNVDNIGKTLNELIKQLSAKNPKAVKAPKLDKITRSDSYTITYLGRQYLDFIDEPN